MVRRTVSFELYLPEAGPHSFILDEMIVYAIDIGPIQLGPMLESRCEWRFADEVNIPIGYKKVNDRPAPNYILYPIDGESCPHPVKRFTNCAFFSGFVLTIHLFLI